MPAGPPAGWGNAPSPNPTPWGAPAGAAQAPWAGPGGPGPGIVFGAAPPPPPRRRNGLVLGLAVGVAVLLVAVVAGALVWSARSSDDEPDAAAEERTYPDEWDPRVAELADWVADERDLEFFHPVEVLLLTEEEYRTEAIGGPVDSEGPTEEEIQAEAEETVGVLRALGLVDGEVDLESAGESLAGDGTLAFYSYEEEKVYVRGTRLTPAVRVTLVHELTHVLQDQHFDLGRISDPDFEEGQSLRAIAEGDAGRLEAVYVTEALTAAERQEYQESTDTTVEDSEAALSDVPPALVTLFSAPYALGDGFVAYLQARDGDAAIDDALADPPTEEELLDPAVRDTPQATAQEVAVEAPDGAEVLDEDVFGPLTWYILLASRGEAADALTTVDGWGGDAFVSYRQDDTICTATAVIGDDQAATDRFRLRLASWAAAGPAGAASVEVVDGAVRVTSCDPGAEAPPSGEVGPDLLGIPALRAGLEAGLIRTGANPEQASCASGRLLAELTFEELTDPSFAGDPALIARVQEIVGGCR